MRLRRRKHFFQHVKSFLNKRLKERWAGAFPTVGTNVVKLYDCGQNNVKLIGPHMKQ